MKLIIPHKLKKGDTIGFISPSAGLAPFAMHRIDNAISFFKKKGFKVKVGKNALKNNGYVSASIEDRISDFHEMFSDPKVKAIICTIGGNNSNQLLSKIDWKLIKENPKIFMGYSDISVLHFALQKKANLVTYYGPCVMTQFGEYPSTLEYTWDLFSEQVINKSKKSSEIVASKKWTDETPDWFKKFDLNGPRKLFKNKGYEWLRKGKAVGRAWGGTIPSINYLMGTDYWIKPQNSIFFLDIPEGKDVFSGLPLSEVDAYLTNLFNADVFEHISGMIIGRPYRYSESDQKELKNIVLRIMKNYKFPILYNANIGHADPIITLRYGQTVKLDSAKNQFQIFD